ncbi:YdeI/OmpD-associated family protein [Herbiconiux sp. P17]|uniref:YdeI/OmpD-associated family protein n=1 Tax=Herbiconiux wuyangfengii TaxID=3342794 RepID=UPI0035B7AA7F
MAEKARTETDRIRFTADVVVVGDRAIVRFPAEASAKLPSRGQVAVLGEMNGQAFEAVVEPDGARGHWLGVDASAGAWRGSLGEGDSVTVEIERNDAWPEPQVPSEFEEALAETPAADETWSDITPMARWEWVRWVNATKNPQTRDRRIEVSMSKLGKGMRRPCCFDLASCTDPELSKNGKLLGLS